jgi:hypothetical protein
MEHEYKNFNRPATICRKNAAIEARRFRERRGRVLESTIQDRTNSGSIPKTDFLSLKL